MYTNRRSNQWKKLFPCFDYQSVVLLTNFNWSRFDDFIKVNISKGITEKTHMINLSLHNQYTWNLCKHLKFTPSKNKTTWLISRCVIFMIKGFKDIFFPSGLLVIKWFIYCMMAACTARISWYVFGNTQCRAICIYYP